MVLWRNVKVRGTGRVLLTSCYLINLSKYLNQWVIGYRQSRYSLRYCPHSIPYIDRIGYKTPTCRAG